MGCDVMCAIHADDLDHASHQVFPACRVCTQRQLDVLTVLDGKTYWRCGCCQATLLADAHFPTAIEERARYDQHRNDINDARYCDFLRALAEPLLRVLPPKQVGLDYGCGPAPALTQMLTDAGHQMHLYDPFFHADLPILQRQFDFITCTETVEHFHHPRQEFARLDQSLRVGGWLAIMTNFQTIDAKFANWHYRRDPTHVTFYRAETFSRIAADFGWTCQFPARNIALMHKDRAA